MTRHNSWPDRLKWAEEQGLKNLGEKFSTGDNMNKEAQTTLTYVLAGMGGSFTFVVKALDSSLTAATFGTAVLLVYFTALGVYLALSTFLIGDFPSPYQQPKNLLAEPQLAVDEIREGELDNIEARITDAAAWIGRKSRAINIVRVLLVLSPVVFALAVCGYKWSG